MLAVANKVHVELRTVDLIVNGPDTMYVCMRACMCVCVCVVTTLERDRETQEDREISEIRAKL